MGGVVRAVDVEGLVPAWVVGVAVVDAGAAHASVVQVDGCVHLYWQTSSGPALHLWNQPLEKLHSQQIH